MALRISSLSRLVSSPSFSASLTIVTSSPSVMVSFSPVSNRLARNFFHAPNRAFSGVKIVTNALSTGAKAMARVSGISFAMLLGVISPKVRTSRVMTIVETVGPYTPPTRRVNSTVASEDAPMFTILFPIRMVLSRLS